jgi:REP element-mobilizing transposase RayT
MKWLNKNHKRSKKMLHSYTKIWLHVIWSVKNRKRIISPEKAIVIRKHIIEYANKEGIKLESINIQPEHMHTSIELPSDMCVKDIVKKLKGESSHYINSTDLFKFKFNWQRGYGAFSFGASQLEVVKNYISNQANHHRKQNFNTEWNMLLEKYGLIGH